MNHKSMKILKKAGWFPNKKIDISEVIQIFENNNIEVFDEAKKFFEEFGDITIKTKSIYSKKLIPYHTFDIGIILKYGYRERLSEELSVILNKKVICVGSYKSADLDVYIDEDGKIYDDLGLIGEDSSAFWDVILNTISDREYKSRTRTWESLGMSEALDKLLWELY